MSNDSDDFFKQMDNSIDLDVDGLETDGGEQEDPFAELFADGNAEEAFGEIVDKQEKIQKRLYISTFMCLVAGLSAGALTFSYSLDVLGAWAILASLVAFLVVGYASRLMLFVALVWRVL